MHGPNSVQQVQEMPSKEGDIQQPFKTLPKKEVIVFNRAANDVV